MFEPTAPAQPATDAAALPDRFFYVLPATAMILGTGLGGILPLETAESLGAVLLAASVLFCGLPHGAGDLWALELAGLAAGRRLAIVLLYLLAALATLAVWFVAPPVALAGFLLLTAWHFGSADAALLTGGRAGGLSWWTQACARGAMVMAAPLAFYPEESERLLGPFALQDAASQLPLIRFLLTWAPAITGAAVVLQALAALPRLLAAKTGAITAERRRAVLALGETCLVAALFWVAPPLLAFACYWIGAHAWRHILRIEALQRLDDAPSAAAASPIPSDWRLFLDYHRRTFGLTLASLGGLAVIFLIWPTLATGAGGWVTAYFLLLSALTVPHALVIACLDWRTAHPLS